MGKSASVYSKKSKKTYCYKGFKQNSKDGQYLKKLFATGELSPAAMPSLIKERYPQFRIYKTDSFSGGVRRLKAKLALNTRRRKGQNTGKLLLVVVVV